MRSSSVLTLVTKWLKANCRCWKDFYVFDFHRAVHRNIIAIVKPTRCTNVRVKGPVTDLEGFRGFQEVKVPRFLDNGTGWCRPYAPAAFTPMKYSWYSFMLEAESTPRAIVRSEGLDAPMYQIYFILEWQSTCFGRSFRPSLGVEDFTYGNRNLSNRYCCMYSLELLMMDGKTVRNM